MKLLNMENEDQSQGKIKFKKLSKTGIMTIRN